MKNTTHPNYLAAIDYKRDQIFVLAPPNLSAIKINGKWKYCSPLTEEEIPNFVLVTDYEHSLKLVNEAKEALKSMVN